jgi:ABC-type uncharacterized transport system permease subunit
MLAGISLTCFTASYTVALALEATRIWFRSGLRGALMLGFGAAGLFAHTLFLGYRAMQSTEMAPLSSEFDWYLIAAWALAAVYLGWTFRQLNAPNERRTAVGLFLLPLVLALVAAAQFLANRELLAREQASGIWLTIHISCVAVGLVSVLLGFVTGVMELVQAYRLKHKVRPQQGLKLPSLEWLQQTGLQTIFSSFTLATLGLLSGMILNVVKGQFSWADPIVWRFGAVVLWLAVAATFTLVYKPARQGRKIAYLTLMSALVVVVSLSIGRILPSGHGAPKHRNSFEQSASVVGTLRVPYHAERNVGDFIADEARSTLSLSSDLASRLRGGAA